MSLEIGKKYRVTFEGEYEGPQGTDCHSFKAPNDFRISAWFKPDTFEYEPAFDPEPPIGSIVLDIEDFAWQRTAPDGKWRRISDGLYPAGSYGTTWQALNKSLAFGPVKVVYRAEEKADAS